MTLRGKLFANAFVTVAGILLIGAASLFGFFQVKQSIREVTDRSTPYQLKTLEFTKALQEHTNGLMEVANASVAADVDRKEGDLKEGIIKLRALSSEIQSFKVASGTVEIGRTAGEVEGLTHEIIHTTRERIGAEDRAAASVREAHRRLKMLAEDRMALQASLKRLQGKVISNLTRSNRSCSTPSHPLGISAGREASQAAPADPPLPQALHVLLVDVRASLRPGVTIL